jgi:hypothetical protein
MLVCASRRTTALRWSGCHNRSRPSLHPPNAHHRTTCGLWAVLIARIYEVLPLLCPVCGGQMRLIAFITHSADIRQILDHIGVDSQPPHITPARGPPLWGELACAVASAAAIALPSTALGCRHQLRQVGGMQFEGFYADRGLF